jgi:protein TonB
VARHAKSSEERVTHPNSPVQPGEPFRWRYAGLALLATIAAWGWQNDWDLGGADRPDPPVIIEPRKAVPETGSLVAIFSNDDYPDAAIRRNEQGAVAFQIDINRRGRVDKCTVTSSSGSAALDNATCTVVRKRARYQPARDNHGRAQPSTDHGRVRWVLPDM